MSMRRRRTLRKFAACLLLDGVPRKGRYLHAALNSYTLSDASFVYPVASGSNLGDVVRQWLVRGDTNVFGEPGEVNVMSSEACPGGGISV